MQALLPAGILPQAPCLHLVKLKLLCTLQVLEARAAALVSAVYLKSKLISPKQLSKERETEKRFAYMSQRVWWSKEEEEERRSFNYKSFGYNKN